MLLIFQNVISQNFAAIVFNALCMTFNRHSSCRTFIYEDWSCFDWPFPRESKKIRNSLWETWFIKKLTVPAIAVFFLKTPIRPFTNTHVHLSQNTSFYNGHYGALPSTIFHQVTRYFDMVEFISITCISTNVSMNKLLLMIDVL